MRKLTIIGEQEEELKCEDSRGDDDDYQSDMSPEVRKERAQSDLTEPSPDKKETEAIKR